MGAEYGLAGTAALETNFAATLIRHFRLARPWWMR